MFRSGWRAYRPPITDVVIAGVFVVIGQVTTWGRFEAPEAIVGPRPLNAVLNLLLMSSIAWRRRAPLGVVVWAVGVYFLPRAVLPLDIPLLAGFVPLILLTSSAGYHGTRRQALLAVAAAIVALVTVTLTTPWLRSLDGLAWNSAFLIGPWFAARATREREDKAAGLAVALADERAGTQAAVREAAAAERAHIARELHDIVAHHVSMMVIQVGAARIQLQTGTGGAEATLLDAEDAGRQTLEDLRRLLGVLRADGGDGSAEGGAGASAGAPQPPQPGLGQLEGMVAAIRATGLAVDVLVEGDPVALSTALDLTAYRVVQEALTNTLKHSGASSASVGITYLPSSLHIDVVDDGTEESAGHRGGHGLVGLTERASLFGGTVDAGPAAGGGWRAHVELPLDARVGHPARPLPAS